MELFLLAWCPLTPIINQRLLIERLIIEVVTDQPGNALLFLCGVRYLRNGDELIEELFGDLKRGGGCLKRSGKKEGQAKDPAPIFFDRTHLDPFRKSHPVDLVKQIPDKFRGHEVEKPERADFAIRNSG